MRQLLTGLILCGLCAACTGTSPMITPEMPPEVRSSWGEIQTITSAELTDAPALAIQNGQAMLAWRGRDAAGIRHYAATSSINPTILSLEAFTSFGYTLITAAPGHFHLLWIDTAENESILRLQSAYINENAVAELGINPLSTGQTYHYDAIPDTAGGLHIAWTADLPDEPTLYTSRIDAAGRIGVPSRILDNVTMPALSLASDGALYVTWHREDTIWQGILRKTEIIDARPILDMPLLNDGDRLNAFHSALDSTHQYLFWQIIRADGSPETWWSQRPLNTPDWQPITRLTIFTDGTIPVENPGYNMGTVFKPDSNPQPVTWASPLIGQHSPLAVAVSTPQQNIGILLLQSGQIIGYQTVLENTLLLRPPVIMTDPDKHLYLAWSEIADDLKMHLNITSTR
ncbi:MAG: hypothetical protein ACPG7F_12560 [Aggregatilineales bacterium]